MADQSPELPWNLLTSNLHWNSSDHCNCGVNNLRPKHNENQSNDFNRFVKILAETLEGHAAKERKKYPDHYDPPKDTDVVIGETLAKKIAPTVHRWYDLTFKNEDCDEEHCGNKGQCICPPFPPYQKTAAAFCQSFGFPPCYAFFPQERSGFMNCEILKTLLIYGEMDPILRVCAHPSVSIETWYSQGQCYCVGDDIGWNNLFRLALKAYLCLNVIYHFPELWDVTSDNSDEKTYRNTAFYQLTIRTCTEHGPSDVQTFPFRRFFGIEDPQTHTCGFGSRGLKDPKDLPHHMPNLSDVQHVRSMLYQKGLPIELLSDIMERADYRVKQRLKVAHDPLHPLNKEIMADFLTYCWQLMVRVMVVVKELGTEAYLHNMIAQFILDFWSDPCGKLEKWHQIQDGQIQFVKVST